MQNLDHVVVNEDLIASRLIELSDEILARGKRKRGQMYWTGLDGDLRKDGTPFVNEVIKNTLYSGSAGPAFLFLEMYHYTGQEKYKEAVLEANAWLLQNHDLEKKNYAFYTGRIGVAFVLAKIMTAFGVTENEAVIEKIIRESRDFVWEKNVEDDVLGGIGGSLWGLVLIYTETKKDYILDVIDHYLKVILDKIHYSPVKGLHWDNNYRQARGLCGFSHGAAGMATLFLELGRFFNNPTFFLIAEQAMTYENQWYDEKLENWPDFRQGISTYQELEDSLQAIEENNTGYFTGRRYMCAWCHGATGIGFARARAYELLQKETYKKDLLASARTTARMELSGPLPDGYNYSLCHGGGGSLALLVETTKVLEDEQYREEGINIIQRAFEHRDELGIYRSGLFQSMVNDNGLFMGEAGVAYALLYYLNHTEMDNLMSPVISGKADLEPGRYPSLELSREDLLERLIRKRWKHTLPLVKAFGLEPSIPEDLAHEDIPGVFGQALEAMDKRHLEEEQQHRLSDAMEFDREIFEVQKSILSHALERARLASNEQKKEKLQDWSLEGLKAIPIKLMEGVRSVNTEYNWGQPEPEVGEYAYLLIPTQKGTVKSLLISDFVEVIVDEIPELGATLGEVISAVLDYLEVDPQDTVQVEKVTSMAFNQLVELIRTNIVVLQ